MRAGKNIRIFKNPILEKFTYVHPLTPIALWGPLTVYWFSSGLIAQQVTFKKSLVLAVAGLFIWTLSEYLLHRFVFHFKPKTPFQRRIAFLIHGVHHDDPTDERRLLMPPIAGLILAALFYVLFGAILGSVDVKPFFAGFIIGYLCYDYTHFAVHFFKLRSNFFKALKKNHMDHHFVTPQKRFGVSNPLWDYVFGSRG